MWPVPGYRIPVCVSLHTDISLLLKADAIGLTARRLCLVGQGKSQGGWRSLDLLWEVDEEGLAVTRTGFSPLLQSRGSTNVRNKQGMTSVGQPATFTAATVSHHQGSFHVATALPFPWG